MEKNRVLHVVGHLGKGGDTTAILSVNNYIKKNNEKYIFDYITHNGCDMNLVNKLKDEGSKIYILDGDVRKIGPFKYYKAIKKILKENRYDNIHFHTSFQSCIGLLAAKKCGVKNRICHSHTSSVQRKCNKIAKIILPFCKLAIKYTANKFIACSEEAAHNLFGKNYKVIYNGLDIEKMLDFDDNEFNEIKKSIGYDNNKIYIGHVGRVNDMKNQEYTIELSKILDKNRYEFIFLGIGELYDKLKKENLLKNNIHFMGKVDNVKYYMKLFDFLVVPSKYGEGLPVVLIEQQIVNNNCVCLVNSNISKEANLGRVKYIDIKKKEEWISNLASKNASLENHIEFEKFNINVTAKEWLNEYI